MPNSAKDINKLFIDSYPARTWVYIKIWFSERFLHCALSWFWLKAVLTGACSTATEFGKLLQRPGCDLFQNICLAMFATSLSLRFLFMHAITLQKRQNKLKFVSQISKYMKHFATQYKQMCTLTTTISYVRHYYTLLKNNLKNNFLPWQRSLIINIIQIIPTTSFQDSLQKLYILSGFT